MDAEREGIRRMLQTAEATLVALAERDSPGVLPLLANVHASVAKLRKRLAALDARAEA